MAKTFRTKMQTLALLSSHRAAGRILPFLRLAVRDYAASRKFFLIRKIKKKRLIYVLQHCFSRVTVFNMSDALKAKIKQRADFDSPSSEATLNLMVAADVIRGQMDRFFGGYEITTAQYNVLRILRGAESDGGHPRCEIAARMIERAPDLTRIIDRLEKQDLVARDRTVEDRRLSLTKISRKGLELLARIEPELIKVQLQIAQKLSAAEWIALTTLCEKIYASPSKPE